MEISLKNLTVKQIVFLHSYLNLEKDLVSSHEILENLITGKTHSLSALSSLQNTNPPVLKKLARKSSREGYLWYYDGVLGEKDKLKDSVNMVCNRLAMAGVIATF